MTLGRAVVLLMLAAAPLDAQSSLTIVAPAAPGGGWDQTARVMQRVLAELEPAATVQVDNIPGAAGTIGLARFVQSQRGNPNALLVTGPVMVGGAIINASPVSLSDATSIARLTGETEVIVVPVASPHRTNGGLDRGVHTGAGPRVLAGRTGTRRRRASPPGGRRDRRATAIRALGDPDDDADGNDRHLRAAGGGAGRDPRGRSDAGRCGCAGRCG